MKTINTNIKIVKRLIRRRRQFQYPVNDKIEISLDLMNTSYQEYGRSPVCTLSCSLRVFLHENVFPHPSSGH